MAGSSKIAVVSALIGNGLIAITKFGAAAYTGSSAMLSEAIHSLVDTGNQFLLLHGMKQAEKQPSSAHPFGHGKELYFWSFVVAMVIFGVGAGLSIYEGVHALMAPKPVENAFVNYIVLGLAMVFEGGASILAFREFYRRKGDMGVIEAIKRGKDPALFTVVMEDSAAVVGLAVAAIWIFLNDRMGLLWAEDHIVDEIRDILRTDRRVMGAKRVMTMHLGPQDVLLAVDVDFSDKMSANDVEAATLELEDLIKERLPDITRIYIEAVTLR
jgi:divalent metal cation (Fe/Co/Zn/Cd) transporter